MHCVVKIDNKFLCLTQRGVSPTKLVFNICFATVFNSIQEASQFYSQCLPEIKKQVDNPMPVVKIQKVNGRSKTR